MLSGQEIKSRLFWELPTFLYDVTEESWAFAVPENHEGLGL